MASILSVARDTELLRLRSAILRQAGYTVIEVSDPHVAISAFLSNAPDLVLLCHTLPSDQKSALIHNIHAFNPRVPILSLDAEHSNIEADVVISSMDGPKIMLASVAQLLSRRASV